MYHKSSPFFFFSLDSEAAVYIQAKPGQINIQRDINTCSKSTASKAKIELDCICINGIITRPAQLLRLTSLRDILSYDPCVNQITINVVPANLNVCNLGTAILIVIQDNIESRRTDDIPHCVPDILNGCARSV